MNVRIETLMLVGKIKSILTTKCVTVYKYAIEYIIMFGSDWARLKSLSLTIIFTTIRIYYYIQINIIFRRCFEQAVEKTNVCSTYYIHYYYMVRKDAEKKNEQFYFRVIRSNA